MPIINVIGAGDGLNLGNFPTLGDLQTAHPTGEEGNIAVVDNGSPSGNAVLYMWDPTDGAWIDSTAAGAYIPLTEKAAANGVATLDGGGKVPTSQLPSSVMEYKGTWNANTNTPALADGAGDNGDVYLVDTAGTQDLGSGNIDFAVGDWVVYNGAEWEKSLNSQITEFNDNTFRVNDNADPTKQIALEAGSIATGQVRTITMPNKDVTLDDAADERPPSAHASEHTDGTDDIQSASASQKGLVDTAAQSFAGDKTFDDDVAVGKAVRFTGVVNVTVTGDDFLIPASASDEAYAIRLTAAADYTIAGIDASSPEGNMIMLLNAGSTKLTITDINTAVATNDRFRLPFDKDIILEPDDNLILWYDDINDKWKLAGSRAANLTDTDISEAAWLLDEDNMASDDATKAASQQSIKKYVDDSIGAIPAESDPIVGAVNGLVKANGAGTISAAVANTDYQVPPSEGAFVNGDKTKLDGIEDSADVTDSTNVAAAGATMDADTSLAGNSYFLDEDDMVSDDATKVASQQSIKKFVEDSITAIPAESDPVVGAVSGIVKANGAGTISAAVGNTDYQVPPSEGAFANGDKTKLDGIAVNANNYSHPNHSGDVTSVGDGAQTIAAGVVGNTKLADMAQDTIKGRVAAGAGDPEDLSPAQVRTMLNVEDGANAYVHPNHGGDVTSVGDGAQTIAANAVDNTKAADMPANTLKGNDTGGAADPKDLTAAEARTLLDVYTQSEVDTLVDATMKAPEAYDPAGSGNFPTTYGGEAVQKGDSFRITTADTLGTGTVVNAEDLLIALVDTPAQTDANWMVAESNRDQATESVKGVAAIAANADITTGIDDEKIVTALKLATYATMKADTTLAGNGYFLDEDDMASDDDTKVPSQQSVKAYVDDSSKPLVNQVGHGLAVGDIIYNNVGTWEKALADDRDTLAFAMVAEVIDVDTFRYASYGRVTVTGHGFATGEYLFLSAVLAGGLTTTEPQGLTLFSDPVCKVVDANTLEVLPFRPSDSIPRPNDVRFKTITAADSPYAVEDTDEMLYCDTGAGDIEVILPAGADYTSFTCGVKKITNDAGTITSKCSTGNVEGVLGTTGHVISIYLNGNKYSSDGVDYWALP
jgi:hypothetical protein